MQHYGQPAQPTGGPQSHEEKISILWTDELNKMPCDSRSLVDLNKLPQIRQLAPRKNHKFLNIQLRKCHEAALGYTRGRVSSTGCKSCARNIGPFAECVILVGWFAGACCNCYYNTRGNECFPRCPSKALSKVHRIVVIIF